MAERIQHLNESACYECDVEEQCDELIVRNPAFRDIKTMVFGRKGYDRESCSLRIGLVSEVRNE